MGARTARAVGIAAGVLGAVTVALPCAAGAAAIINGTHTAMVALELRPSDGGVWGPDLLKSGPLGIQMQIPVDTGGNPSCVFDIKAVFEDGHRRMQPHVYLCRSQAYLFKDF